MKKLFLAWQDPISRRWFTVGRLTADGGTYQFVYTQGVREAQDESAFQPLPAFPDLHQVYESEKLFPLFSNRLLPRSRPDYKDFVKWLSIPEHDDDPFALLARSGGQRVTDTLEVFPCPEPDSNGQYHVHFFVHGLGHMPDASIKRAETLQQGEHLLLMHDFQNPRDPHALLLRTAELTPRDLYLVGYCPRYLLDDTFKLMDKDQNLPRVTVERVNQPPAPIQFRLLCQMTMQWSENFQPFSSPTYQPLEPDIVTAM